MRPDVANGLGRYCTSANILNLINSISRSQFYTKLLCKFKAHIRIIERIFLGKDVRINISSTALMFVWTSWHEKFAALRSHIASTRVTGGEMGNGTVSSIWRLKKLKGFWHVEPSSHCLSVFIYLLQCWTRDNPWETAGQYGGCAIYLTWIWNSTCLNLPLSRDMMQLPVASLLAPNICCILHRSILHWYKVGPGMSWARLISSMLFVSNKVVDSPTSLPGTSQLSTVVHPRANVQWIPWKLWKRTAAIDERPKRFAPRHDLEMSQSITDQLDTIHAYSLSIFQLVHDLFPTAMPKHKAWHSMAPSRGANQAWARRAVACKCFQISLSLAGDGACVGSGIDLRPDSDWWPKMIMSQNDGCFMGSWVFHGVMRGNNKIFLELFWFGYDSVQLQYATILLEFLTVARKQLVSWSSEWRYNVYNPQPAENIESFTWNNFIWLFDPGHPCLDSVHCVQLSSQNISGILPWVGPSSFWVIWCWDILRWWWWQVIDGCDVSLACFVTRRAGVSNVQKLSLDVIDQARRHNTTNDGCLSAWEVWSKSE